MEENKKIWNECFDKVEAGVRKQIVHYKDQLVDLIAHLIDESGYSIVKK